MCCCSAANAVKRIFFNLIPRARSIDMTFNEPLSPLEIEWVKGMASFQSADVDGTQLCGDHMSNAILFFEGFVKHHTGDTQRGRMFMVAALQAKCVDMPFIDSILDTVSCSPEKIIEVCVTYGVRYLPELELILRPLKDKEFFKKYQSFFENSIF